METLWNDVKYGVRMLRKNRGVTLVALVALALGIGANSAIFSVVDAYLLRPLPYPGSERMVVALNDGGASGRGPVSLPNFQDWRAQNQAFEEMVAVFHTQPTFLGVNEPRRLRSALVSENYFPFLGAQPLLGRTFLPEDHRPGAAPVVLVSHLLWQEEFGGDRGLIGRSILLNGRAHTVVGVLPPDAPNLRLPEDMYFWTPLEANPPWNERGVHYLTVLARMKPGISQERAQADMNLIARRISEANQTEWGVALVPLREQIAGDVRAGLLVLLAAVGFVLLIACANVANLLLARSAARSREFAVRAALGAGRARLARLLLTESILLALAGGVLGVLLAVWTTDLLMTHWPATMRRPVNFGVDWRVVGFSATLSLVVGVLFGLLPALQSSRTDLSSPLKESSGRASAGASRRRSLLVVFEVALALVLLVGAGLMLNSFVRLLGTSPGFDANNVLALDLSLPGAKYSEDWQRREFFSTVLERTATLPGVTSAGAVLNLPLGGGGMDGSFEIEGRPPFSPSERPSTEKQIVSPGYFRTLGIPLLRGRTFTEQDREGLRRVVIINETFARRFWPNEDPIGKRIDTLSPDGEWEEIIGVVGDVKLDGLANPSRLEAYVCYLQFSTSGMTVVLHTAGEPLALAAAARGVVRGVDSELPVRVRAVEQVVSRSLGAPRLSTFFLGAIAALALLLAAVGIYGVLAYAISQRTREIGIRMALGAERRDILGLVVRDGLGLTLAGMALGLAGSAALTRFLRTQLYQVSPTDPATFAAVAALLVLVALAACYIPARRAARVDPIVALRYE